MAPKDVSKDKETQVWINLYGNRLSPKRRKGSKFRVGDSVRLSIKKVLFMERYQENGPKKCLLLTLLFIIILLLTK